MTRLRENRISANHCATLPLWFNDAHLLNQCHSNKDTCKNHKTLHHKAIVAIQDLSAHQYNPSTFHLLSFFYTPGECPGCNQPTNTHGLYKVAELVCHLICAIH